MKKDFLIVYTATIERPENPLYLGDEIPGVVRMRVKDKDLPVKVKSLHPHRRAMYAMMHPHELLPPHEYSIWIDGSESLRIDPTSLLAYLHSPLQIYSWYTYTYNLALPHHWAKGDLYDEGEREIKMGRTQPAGKVVAQMAYYEMQGYPKGIQMCLDGIVVRRNSPVMQKFNELWWEEYEKWHTRADMMAMMYVLWKYKVSYSIIPGKFWDYVATWQQAKPHVSSGAAS